MKETDPNDGTFHTNNPPITVLKRKNLQRNLTNTLSKYERNKFAVNETFTDINSSTVLREN